MSRATPLTAVSHEERLCGTLWCPGRHGVVGRSCHFDSGSNSLGNNQSIFEKRNRGSGAGKERKQTSADAGRNKVPLPELQVHVTIYCKPVWLIHLLSRISIHRSHLGCASLQFLGPGLHSGNRESSWRKHRWPKSCSGNGLGSLGRCHLHSCVWAEKSMRGLQRRGEILLEDHSDATFKSCSMG